MIKAVVVSSETVVTFDRGCREYLTGYVATSKPLVKAAVVNEANTQAIHVGYTPKRNPPLAF
jgi:hypothetical protein